MSTFQFKVLDAKGRVQRGRVELALVIPPDFDARIARARRTWLIDATPRNEDGPHAAARRK